MDAIKGSELQIPAAIFAWVLDGQGGVKPLADDDIIDKDKPCWLHLNYTHSDSADWLAASMARLTSASASWLALSPSPAWSAQVPRMAISAR